MRDKIVRYQDVITDTNLCYTLRLNLWNYRHCAHKYRQILDTSVRQTEASSS